MLDLLLEGGTVIDGTGAAPRTADVGIRDGRIVEVGRITEATRERVDATGAWVTPGFIDIHTHYDGQASWDETFSPSIHHGVTTLMMGNCGVGFAPVRPDEQERLIQPDGGRGGHPRRGARRGHPLGLGALPSVHGCARGHARTAWTSWCRCRTTRCAST